eukprot:scaffold228865_cov27-Tisochrysis_lutea.AAC.1
MRDASFPDSYLLTLQHDMCLWFCARCASWWMPNLNLSDAALCTAQSASCLPVWVDTRRGVPHTPHSPRVGSW